MTHPSAAVTHPSAAVAPPDEAAAPGGQRRLHVVPPPNDPIPADAETATCNAPENTPLDHVSAGQDLAGHAETDVPLQSADRIRDLWASSKRYWTPPAVFTQRPASLADLGEYATRGGWTGQDRGLIRTAGTWYYRLFGYPYTVISRYREWFAQRPLRLVAGLGLTKLISLTGPGSWVVHHVVYPVAHFAGHVFL